MTTFRPFPAGRAWGDVLRGAHPCVPESHLKTSARPAVKRDRADNTPPRFRVVSANTGSRAGAAPSSAFPHKGGKASTKEVHRR
jgi:hypothetical protein